MTSGFDRDRMNCARDRTPAGRVVLRLLMAVVIWQIGGAAAHAQFGANNPANTPTVSPYLNLFRSNNRNSPVLNYYGLVRPQNRAIQQGQQFNRGLLNLQQQQAQRPNQAVRRGYPQYSQLGTTGHPTAFMTIGGAASLGAAGGGGVLGGSFVNDGVGIGVSNVGVPGGGFDVTGGGFGAGVGAGGIGAAGGLGAGGFGAAGGLSGGGFGAGAVPGIYTGYGIGTSTGHPAVYGAGAGSTGTGFGNQ